MNKEEKTKYTIIALFFALLFGVIFCLISEIKKLKGTEKQREELITETTADSVKYGVIHLTEEEMETAKNKTIKQMADTIEYLKKTKKIKTVEKIAYIKQVARDTIRFRIPTTVNDLSDRQRPLTNGATANDFFCVKIDTTINRPWSEYRLIIDQDSIMIKSLIRSELICTWGVQKYDNHRTWLGRFFHKDKKRKVVRISESNPSIILEQSEYVEMQ